MSISLAMQYGKHDRTCGMSFIPDFYGIRGLARMAYAVGWLRGGAK